MQTDFTYLDYNATAPMRAAVKSAVHNASSIVGNPSSVHRYGRLAKQTLNQARDQIAKFINCLPHEIIFCGSGTEANNQILRLPKMEQIFISAVEHDSVLKARDDVKLLTVDANGLVDLENLERQLATATGTILVSVMLANNESGIIQPIADVVALAKKYKAYVHCDAVQALGKMPVDFAALNVDAMTISAHKIGGPHGIAALVVKESVPLSPLIRGGGQERNLRAGTHNVEGIAGFGVAAAFVEEHMDHEIPQMQSLRNFLEKQLTDLPVTIFGKDMNRLPTTSLIGFPNLKAETQVMYLDLAGVAVSAGAACSSGKVKASHVLKAMGYDDDIAASAIRVSVGYLTTLSDVERFVEAYKKMVMEHDTLSLNTKQNAHI